MENIDYYFILRYLTGKASEEESSEFEKWLGASPENRQLFAEVEKIWQNADPEEPERIPDVAETWSEIEDRLNLGKTKAKARILTLNRAHRFSNWGRITAAAAAIIIFVGGTLLYLNFRDANRWQQAHTQNGQRMQLELQDGSLVHLNGDSKFRYPSTFLDSTRIVHLSGEAFFEVAHDDVPFIVKTENARIRVLGTKFNIWARDEQTRVVVENGSVALSALELPDNPGIVLTAQQTGIIRKNNVPEKSTTVDSEKLLDWMQNRIVFDQTPLSEIISELQRVYNVSIQLNDSGLGEKTVTGTFLDKPVETALESICLTLGLKYTLENGKYVISED